MGLVYLALSLLSFTSIGVLIKLGERNKCSASGMNVGLYGFGTVLFLLLSVANGEKLSLTPTVIGLGLLSGVASFHGVYYTCLAARYGGVGKSMGISYMAIGIPVIMGWIVWQRVPPVSKLLGLVLIALAICIISKEQDNKIKSEESKENVDKAGTSSTAI